MVAERGLHRSNVARIPLEAVDAVLGRELLERLDVVVPARLVGEVPHAADAAPPPLHTGPLALCRLVVGEDILALDHVALAMAQQLVLATVGAHERRSPDHRLPALFADACEHSLGVREVARIERIAALVGIPATIHQVDATRESTLRECLRVGVHALLGHPLDGDLDPVVPLRQRKEQLRRRLAVEREMLRRRDEISLLQRLAGNDRLDLLRLRGNVEHVIRERVDKRLVAPHVAPRARHEERRRHAPGPRQIHGFAGVAIGHLPAPLQNAAPPLLTGQRFDDRTRVRPSTHANHGYHKKQLFFHAHIVSNPVSAVNPVRHLLYYPPT